MIYLQHLRGVGCESTACAARLAALDRFGVGEILGKLRSFHEARCRAPNLAGVLRNRPVAGELAGARHVDDRLVRPGIGVAIEIADSINSRKEAAIIPAMR